MIFECIKNHNAPQIHAFIKHLSEVLLNDVLPTSASASTRAAHDIK